MPQASGAEPGSQPSQGPRPVTSEYALHLTVCLCRQRVAWACCWLATKLEEEPRRPQDLLSVFNRVDERREGKTEAVLDRFSQVCLEQCVLYSAGAKSGYF